MAFLLPPNGRGVWPAPGSIRPDCPTDIPKGTALDANPEHAAFRSQRRRLAPVSVVIPCHNAAETVPRAVNSVRRQTWRPAEVILVDDASIDGTSDLLQELAEGKFDPKDRGWIRVCGLARNQGPGAARNAGWNQAAQPLLAFLDADDAWHPEKIAVQADFMLARPHIALSGHRAGRFRSGEPSAPEREGEGGFRVGRIGGPATPPILPRGRASRARRIGAGRLLSHNCLKTRSVMLRRSLPFRFAGDKRRSEDYLLWLEIALSGRSVWRLEAELAFSFKADIGAGGLTANPARMAAAERDTYRRLWRSGLLGPFSTVPALGFSWIRHGLRRLRLMRRR